MADPTDKQRRFVEAYLSNGRNAAEAYRTIYSPNAPSATASREGFRLLQNPKIAPMVAGANQRRAEATKRVEDRYAITPARVLAEYARVGFGDARMVMAWGAAGVTLRESADLTDDEAALVSEVSQTISEGGRTMRIKLHSKLHALDKLGKHLGLWDAPAQDDDALDSMAQDSDPPRIDRGKS